MRTVLKVPLVIGLGDSVGVGDSETVLLPRHAKVRHVAMDPNVPHKIGLWFEVDYENDPVKIQAMQSEERAFIVVGTGRPIPDRSEYVGTVIHTPRAGGHAFVWHVYELR